ncbi:MAG TPA: aminodeoxychorismate synthase component I [Abditibacterium sp.]|jgi:para-aminobenzoate synthetase component 1
MDFGRQILDFGSRRISGARPFLRTENLAELPLQLEDAARRFPHGGAIGFWSYEAAQAWEPRAFPRFSPVELQIPTFRLIFYEELQFAPIPPPQSAAFALPEVPDIPARREFYCRGVETIQNFIAAGDIYQANLTQPFELTSRRTPREIFERLRALGRAPRAALLEWDDLAIVSNSPETFLTLRDGILKSRPIKGTIRRGASAQEDAALQLELQHSAKDRAENVMIVDLLRNDLGRVCEFGSVEVPQLCEIETFPTLHHLVSTVRGQVRADCSPLRAFQACFPCGSITGAPKIRAMQILNELENQPRGVSMGAIGFFGFDGDMEWSVAIRTATFRQNRVHFRVGGGIVADSQPESEYQEMRLKARALYGAIALD